MGKVSVNVSLLQFTFQLNRLCAFVSNLAKRPVLFPLRVVAL